MAKTNKLNRNSGSPGMIARDYKIPQFRDFGQIKAYYLLDVYRDKKAAMSRAKDLRKTHYARVVMVIKPHDGNLKKIYKNSKVKVTAKDYHHYAIYVGDPKKGQPYYYKMRKNG